mgnify:CR=1 FL=1
MFAKIAENRCNAKILPFLHVRAKDTLVQLPSEREATLMGREPSLGCETPVQAVPAIVRFVPKTMSAVYKQYFKAASA